MTQTKQLPAKEEKQEIATENQFSEETLNLIKRTVCKDATNDEFQLFVAQCKRTGLDPFSRQIYFAKDKSGKVQMQSTIDGFRVVANRNPNYAGQTPTLWCGKDGEWKDVWLSDDYPSAAKVGVHRHDFKEPMYATALWKEYAPYFNNNLSFAWKQRPALMLAKCAEALALRKACPNELSGLYTNDEMKEKPEENNVSEVIREAIEDEHMVDIETGEVIPPPCTTADIKDTIDWAKQYGWNEKEIKAYMLAQPGVDPERFLSTFNKQMLFQARGHFELNAKEKVPF